MCNNIPVDVNEYQRLISLQQSVKMFFDKFLNRIEESDGGKLFHPIMISNCRVMTVAPLNNLLDEMAKLSGAAPRKDLHNEH